MNSSSFSGRGRSPIQFMVQLAVAVPLLIGFVYYLTYTSSVYPGHSNAFTIGPASKESVFAVNTTGAYPIDRTAYVYTYAQGRWDDDARLIGVRTSIASLANAGITRQVVVMVDKNVSASDRKVLVTAGAKVVDMPSSNTDPINTSSRSILGSCKNDFAVIHAWSLTDYDRIIWMDSDVLALLNLDELFLCGHFCTVYMNLNWYTSVLFVIKPDAEKHKQLLQGLTQTNPAVMDAGSAYFESGCQQAWEDYMLSSFYPVEAAPAFTSTMGQQEAPVMRLASGYALNPIFWYEKYDWSQARVKEYTAMQGTSLDDVPAHALGWPRFKPWNWFLCMYFNIHSLWFRWSNVLLGISWTNNIICYFALSALFLGVHAFAAQLANKVAPEQPNSRTSEGFRQCIDFLMKPLNVLGWTYPAYTVGCIYTTIIGLVVGSIIPTHMPYFYAWPCYIILFTSTHMMCTRLLSVLIITMYHGVTVVGQIEQRTTPITMLLTNLDSQATLVPKKALAFVYYYTSFQSYMYPAMYISVIYGLLQLEIFPHFVLKIFIFLGTIMYTVILYTSPFVQVVRTQYYQKGTWRD